MCTAADSAPEEECKRERNRSPKDHYSCMLIYALKIFLYKLPHK